MTLGEEEATALGLDTRVLRIVVVAAATLMTSAAVAASGIVGWVGLVVPHLARLTVGPAFTRLLPVSVLFGACYLLAVDPAARNLGPVELPLGVLTAVLGTHTHVPTADDRVLPGGTAYQTDVGMSGPYNSVIGVEKELVLQRFLTGMPGKFEAAKGDPRMAATLIECDGKTGRAISTQRLLLGE